MQHANHLKSMNEWITIGEYRVELSKNPSVTLISWATKNNFDYARLIPKNTIVRKIVGVDNQLKYCNDKAESIKIKMNTKSSNITVQPVTDKSKPVPIINLEMNVPSHFAGVIKGLQDMYHKMGADLVDARIEIQALKQEIAQFKILKPQRV